jgi:hypothetical protein
VTGLAVAAVLLVVGAVSCGLRQDDQPRLIARESLPSVLFQKNPGTSTTAPQTPSTQTFELYLVRADDESLVDVPTPIQPPARAADLPRTVLNQLVTNPPVTADFKSKIAPTTSVLHAEQHDNVLDVDLSGDFATVEGPGLRLAVAQIVFTATSIPGIDFVRFSIDDQPKAVPVDDRSADIGAEIGRGDFAKLIAGSTTSTAPPSTPAPPDTPATPAPTTPPTPTPAVTSTTRVR